MTDEQTGRQDESRCDHCKRTNAQHEELVDFLEAIEDHTHVVRKAARAWLVILYIALAILALTILFQGAG